MSFLNFKENIIKKLLRNYFVDFKAKTLTEEEKKEALKEIENASSLTDEQKENHYKEYVEKNMENITKIEMEKMKAGKPYTSRLPDLFYDRFQCRNFLDKFNSTKGTDALKRNKMLKQFFKHAGENVFIERPFTCEYGYNISMGDDCFMNYDCIILDNAEVTIGKDCWFGPRCQLITASHPISCQQRKEICSDIAKPIRIGNGCFLGASVIVLPGITIGDNVTVGAGSVVTKDIPSNTVVCGNPAKPIRKLEPYVEEVKENNEEVKEDKEVKEVEEVKENKEEVKEDKEVKEVEEVKENKEEVKEDKEVEVVEEVKVVEENKEVKEDKEVKVVEEVEVVEENKEEVKEDKEVEEGKKE